MAFTLLAVGLNLGGIFAGIWLGVAPTLGYLPKPYSWILATQVGCAWLGVAMVWCFRGRYSIFHGLGGRSAESLYSAGERRIWLWGIWFPTLFVFLAYYEFASAVHPLAIVLPACAIGILLFIAGAAPDHELWSDWNRLDLILGPLLCFAYGCAVVLQVNCIFDHSNAMVYEATVSAKRVYSRSPHVTVAPWGPEQRPRSLVVPYRVYKSVAPGDPICMVLRQGALQVSWYTAQPCPYNGAPVSLEPGGTL
jgi:hypothetical protein